MKTKFLLNRLLYASVLKSINIEDLKKRVHALAGLFWFFFHLRPFQHAGNELQTATAQASSVYTAIQDVGSPQAAALQEQVAALKAKVGLLATVRKELLNSAHELTEHLSAG